MSEKKSTNKNEEGERTKKDEIIALDQHAFASLPYLSLLPEHQQYRGARKNIAVTFYSALFNFQCGQI